MTITVYPSALNTSNNCWESVVPMHGAPERLRAKFEQDDDDPFEPNPDYVPCSSMSIAGGNFNAILKVLGLKDLAPEGEEAYHLQIDAVLDACAAVVKKKYAPADMEMYVVLRIIQLWHMAQLGISRGATHIVGA
jgi:hypothetical protein